VVTADRRFIADPKCEYRLIAGERRLRALALCDQVYVSAYVVGVEDAAALLRAEADENTCRKPFAPSEAVSLGRALEGIERARASERRQSTQAKPGEGKVGGGKLPPPERGKTRDKVAEAVGMSGRTYDKAKEVVAAAEADPALVPVVEEMDRTGKVHQAFQEVVRRKKRAKLEAKAAAATPAAPGRCQVVTGDCLEELPKLPAGGFPLIVADLPYNVGVDYGDGPEADLIPEHQFVAWCRDWVAACRRVLAADGSMWVLIGDEYADHMGLILRGAGLHRRAWVKWYETFGVCNSSHTNFSRCSRHLFYCVKNPKRFTFNAEAVSRPSDRQTKYKDKRADPAGKVWDDVWMIPRLQGTSKERVPGFPTQLPLALLTPIVLSTSQPDDLVLDPFCGSGTTGEAALRHGRKFLGVEKNPEFARLARLRLKGVGAG
jgi:site-specific DNA-methyltransferase (adenine-specific)